MDRIVSQKKVSATATTFSVELDVGYLFKGLILRNKNTGTPIPISDFASIEYEVNGTIIWPLTGQELDEINKRDGLPAFDGQELLLPFGLEGMKDQRMRELTYINTGIKSPTTNKIISSHVLRVTFANPQSVDCWALVSENTPDGPGLIRRYQRQSEASAVGSTETSKFTKGTPQFSFWRRIFTKTSAGALLQQQLASPRQQFWGTQVPVAVASLASAIGGHVAGAYFDGVMDFTYLNGGYNALAKTVDKGNGNLQVLPDTPDVPFMPTLALKDDTVTLTNWNDTAGSNGFLLEAVGEID